MHALLAGWREREDTAHLLRYEDLMMQPREAVRSLLRFLELDPGDDAVERILGGDGILEGNALEQHRTSPSFQQSVGRYAHELTPELLRKCEQVFAESMAAFGYQPAVVNADVAAAEAVP
jgi:hypothetical protein